MTFEVKLHYMKNLYLHKIFIRLDFNQYRRKGELKGDLLKTLIAPEVILDLKIIMLAFIYISLYKNQRFKEKTYPWQPKI